MLGPICWVFRFCKYDCLCNNLSSLKFLKFWIILILHWREGNRCCENGSKKTIFYQLHFKVWWWIHKNTFLYWDIIKCYLSKAWYRKTILPCSVFCMVFHTVWTIQYRRFEISAAKMKQSCWNKYIEMCTAFKYLHIQSDIEIWVWKFYIYPLVPIWLMFTFVYIQFICCSLNLDFRLTTFHMKHFLLFRHGILDRSTPNIFQ